MIIKAVVFGLNFTSDQIKQCTETFIQVVEQALASDHVFDFSKFETRPIQNCFGVLENIEN